MSPIDPTAVIERMAGRLRSQGAPHPVAGAVALAARGHSRLDQSEFAESMELLVDVVSSAERGEVSFGELAQKVGMIAEATGADLLALADLEATWRHEPPPVAVDQ